MKRVVKPLLITAAIGLLAYASQIAPYYVAMTSQNKINFIDEKELVTTECSTLEPECKVRYTLNLPKLASHDMGIGLGTIFPYYEATCVGTTFKHKGFFGGDAFGMYLALTSYSFVPVLPTNCEQLDISVLAPDGLNRVGYIGGKLALAERKSLLRIQFITEFFLREIKIISLFVNILLAILVITFFRLNLPIGHVHFDPIVILTWSLFFCFSTGFAEVFLPLEIDPRLNSRIVFILGAFSSVAPILNVYNWKDGWNPLSTWTGTIKLVNRMYIVLAAILFGLAFTSFYGITTPYFLAAGTLIGLRQFWKMKLRATYLVYTVSVFFTACSLWKFSFAPTLSTNIASGLVLGCICIMSVFKNLIQFFGTLLWAQKLSEDREQLSLTEICKSLGQRFGIGRVSVSRVMADATVDCTAVDLTEGDSRYALPSLSPVLAYVHATSESLWHINSESVLGENIRRKSTSTISREYENRNFCALPLKHGSTLQGVLSLSNYDDALTGDRTWQAMLQLSVTKLIPLLVDKLRDASISSRDDWHTVIEEMTAKTAEMTDATTLAIESTKILATKTNKVLWFDFNPENQKLSCSNSAGFASSEKSLIENLILYYNPDNLHGPVPLALAKKSPVCVPDIRWLRSVLHPNTVEFLDACKAKSLAVIPIFGTSENAETTEIHGVYLLLSENLYGFEDSLKGVFTSLAKIIENATSRFLSQMVSTQLSEALTGFIPEHVKASILSGELPYENDTGFLVMIDIKNSTFYSRLLSVERWTQITDQIKVEFEDKLACQGFELHALIWDAFFISRSTSKGALTEDMLVSLIESVGEIISSCLIPALKTVQIGKIDSSSLFRMCVVNGDISRGIKKGKMLSWGITGHAMAVVNKLEQCAKGIEGVLFISEGALSEIGFSQIEFERGSKNIPGTDEAFFVSEKIFQKKRFAA